MNIDGNERINADQITSPGNNNTNKNTNTVVSIEQNEDSTLLENYPSTAKDEKIQSEDDKYLDSNLSWRDLCPQVLASCISLLLVIQPGINLAYSNNLLHHMPSLNKGQFSWITSILALCTPIGAFLIGLIMDRIGRKKACFLTTIPLLTSWVIAVVSNSDSVYLFFASRMFAGIGAGMTSVSMVYVSEITHSSYKQLLLSLNSVFFSGGVLISTSILDLNWNIINYAFIGLTITNMALILLFMPESPIWLLKFKSSICTSKAKMAMKRIYPKNNQVFEMEWKRLKTTSSNDAHVAADETSFMKTIQSRPAAYKPMAILILLILLQQLSGAYPTISYALPVLNLIVTDGGSITEVQSLAVLGVIRFVSALLACAFSFYVGRKLLLMFSCVGMALSAALVAFAYDTTPAAAGRRPLSDGVFRASGGAVFPKVPLSLCGVMLFVFSSSMGVLVFPWTMTCEMLPTSVRAVGGCLLVSFGYLVMFAVMKVFPEVLAALSLPYVFVIFGAVSLTMAAYVHFVVPETFRKTFKEIEDYFTRTDNE